MPVKLTEGAYKEKMSDHSSVNEIDMCGDSGDDLSPPQKFPSNAEDFFELKIIDAVRNHSCIYNRADPLHKMADYNAHVWRQVAEQIGYGGDSVELQRKWRHMRDRYVRLRKVAKSTQSLKEDNKWLAFYEKMSFLDSFIEHRNRQRRVFSRPLSLPNNTTPQHDTDINKQYIASFINPRSPCEASVVERSSFIPSDSSQGSPAARDRPDNGDQQVERELNIGNLPVNFGRKRRHTPALNGDRCDENEVSLFILSIQRTLMSMDLETFSKARAEISRVVYECKYGKERKE